MQYANKDKRMISAVPASFGAIRSVGARGWGSRLRCVRFYVVKIKTKSKNGEPRDRTVPTRSMHLENNHFGMQ